MRRCTQSRKRKRKHSSSVPPDTEPEDSSEIFVPVLELIDPTEARKVVDSFRESVIISVRPCVITGKGKTWCFNAGIGPGVQACHIVPPQHFHVYPNGDDITDFSGQRLVQAWYDTWDSQNGLLLRSDLRELFEARLISIHPDTHRIRAFVPYDMILQYHGLMARIPGIVDRDALAHHYEMICIENMASEMPPQESSTAEFNWYFWNRVQQYFSSPFSFYCLDGQLYHA